MKLADEYVVYAFECVPIEMEDTPTHDTSNPYCDDPSCPCVAQAVLDGLLTEAEAERAKR